MSRLANIPVEVCCNAEGEPVALRFDPGTRMYEILDRFSHWREWIGVLDGEPQRDVWLVEITFGVCELHQIRFPQEVENAETPTPEEWILARWED